MNTHQWRVGATTTLILFMGLTEAAAQSPERLENALEAEAYETQAREGEARGCGLRVVGVRKVQNGWEGFDFHVNLIRDDSPAQNLPPRYGHLLFRLMDVSRGRATEVMPSQAWVRLASHDDVPPPLLGDMKEKNYFAYYVAMPDGARLLAGLLGGNEVVVGVRRTGDEALRTYVAPVKISDGSRANAAACLANLGLMRFERR